ncbi:hypothetical protein [Chryseobacterium scophthalmum]|uniref:hypothetical protein n=1 Tax=Chryseobacterium scophthalmum TaxID=59733 RepID=UPI001AEC2CAB|nr:hypothetical protein [Chryseobacterium scophthalmum]
MKILLVNNNNDCKQNIIDSVAEFLWDSGHEIVKISSDDSDNIEKKEAFKNYDFIISMNDGSEAIHSHTNHYPDRSDLFTIQVVKIKCRSTT